MKLPYLILLFTLITSMDYAHSRGQSNAQVQSLEDCYTMPHTSMSGLGRCMMDLVKRGIARCNNKCCLPAEPFLVRFNNGFGLRTKPYRGNHKGIDFSYNWPVYNSRKEETGKEPVAKVRAAIEGELVTKGRCGSGFGVCMELEHEINGKTYKTRYAHLKPNCKAYNDLQVGQYVGSGDTIACMGSTGRSTGPHLHFEVLNSNGVQINPQNFCEFTESFLNYESI